MFLKFDDFILESKSIYTLSNEVKSTLLELDEKYHKLIEKFRTKYVAQTISNIKEEFEKFINARNNGQKYFPQLEIENSEVDMDLLDKFSELKDEFGEIESECYIAKFYIEKIESMIHSLEMRKELENNEYVPGENPVDKELYNDALECIKKHPYHKPDS